MENPTQYASIAEKFEAITKGKRPNNIMVWVTNHGMNALPAHQGNPVLLEVTAKQFARPNNPYLKQGVDPKRRGQPIPEIRYFSAVCTGCHRATHLPPVRMRGVAGTLLSLPGAERLAAVHTE